MSDGPQITPEAAEGLRLLMKARREGKFPYSPYPVVAPHVARPPKDDTLQYSKRESRDHWWPTDQTTSTRNYDLLPHASGQRNMDTKYFEYAGTCMKRRARRHSWFVAFGITLFLCVAAGIAYLITDPIFPMVVVCSIVGCG